MNILAATASTKVYIVQSCKNTLIATIILNITFEK